MIFVFINSGLRCKGWPGCGYVFFYLLLLVRIHRFYCITVYKSFLLTDSFTTTRRSGGAGSFASMEHGRPMCAYGKCQRNRPLRAFCAQAKLHIHRRLSVLARAEYSVRLISLSYRSYFIICALVYPPLYLYLYLDFNVCRCASWFRLLCSFLHAHRETPSKLKKYLKFYQPHLGAS